MAFHFPMQCKESVASYKEMIWMEWRSHQVMPDGYEDASFGKLDAFASYMYTWLEPSRGV